MSPLHGWITSVVASAFVLASWAPVFSPDAAPRYAPPQLQCARFHETSRSNLETYVAGQTRRETLGLDGDWRFRAAPAPGDSLRIEAWFDTLSVFRRFAGGAIEPETDALVGGRYRGVLSAEGGYRADARPFVPDDVAEVADLSRELDDLLPRLPRRALAVGATWEDGMGLEVRRLADSSDSIWRFRSNLARENREERLQGDSVPLQVRQSTRDEGTFVWDAHTGLLRRERHITIETYVPVEPRVRRPVRSRLEQDVVLERIVGGC